MATDAEVEEAARAALAAAQLAIGPVAHEDGERALAIALLRGVAAVVRIREERAAAMATPEVPEVWLWLDDMHIAATAFQSRLEGWNPGAHPYSKASLAAVIVGFVAVALQLEDYDELLDKDYRGNAVDVIDDAESEWLHGSYLAQRLLDHEKLK